MGITDRTQQRANIILVYLYAKSGKNWQGIRVLNPITLKIKAQEPGEAGGGEEMGQIPVTKGMQEQQKQAYSKRSQQAGNSRSRPVTATRQKKQILRSLLILCYLSVDFDYIFSKFC